MLELMLSHIGFLRQSGSERASYHMLLSVGISAERARPRSLRLGRLREGTQEERC